MREVGRSKITRNRKKQIHEHISLPMAKSDVTIPMAIILRSTLVFGKVTRLASITWSFVFSFEMVNAFKMMMAITAAKDMAHENNMSRIVTRASESQVVMTHMWLTVVTYQHKFFSPANMLVSLM